MLALLNSIFLTYVELELKTENNILKGKNEKLNMFPLFIYFGVSRFLGFYYLSDFQIPQYLEDLKISKFTHIFRVSRISRFSRFNDLKILGIQGYKVLRFYDYYYLQDF